MLEVKYSTKFKKDLKVCQKRHYDMTKLQQIINVLAIPAALLPQNKDHSLTGSYIPHRECHIQPDWLLVYYPRRKQSCICIAPVRTLICLACK